MLNELLSRIKSLTFWYFSNPCPLLHTRWRY